MLSKRISKTGGFTLPKAIRAEVGMFGGNVVDVEVVDGGIFIKKHTCTCKLCGAVENVIEYKGFEVCKSCIDEMQEVANG